MTTRDTPRRKPHRPKKKKSVSEVMASIHSTDTRPELAARHWLWTHGYRYRKNEKDLPGKPDIVITTARTAIFIHGCFWHQHEGCQSYSTPRTNTPFWQEKFARNKARDERVRIELRALGWRTMVIWECQLKPDKIDATMEAAAKLIDGARKECQNKKGLRNTAIKNTYDTDFDDAGTLTYAAEETEMDYYTSLDRTTDNQ